MNRQAEPQDEQRQSVPAGAMAPSDVGGPVSAETIARLHRADDEGCAACAGGYPFRCDHGKPRHMSPSPALIISYCDTCTVSLIHMGVPVLGF